MIDNSLHVPILHRYFFNEEDNSYINVLNKEIDRLMDLNGDCWGRLDTENDTWSSYPINKDILFNNPVFDDASNGVKDIINQYAMSVRADTQRHQIHMIDSSIYVCGSNPKKQYTFDDSQHFVGYIFLKAEEQSGNLIIRNPVAPKRRLHHNGDSPLREYFIKQVNTGDIVILPSHIEHKMTDFSENSELRFVKFGITVA